jgi:hypothetical protein
VLFVWELIALTLVLLSTAASAGEWVVLRKPSDPGQVGTPVILVDTTSIEILDNGIRRARHKTDFLGRRLEVEKFDPTVVSFMIFVTSYDCEKQMTHSESMESHQVDGSVHGLDLSKNPKWYPAPQNRAADPTIDFVCGWNPSGVLLGS